MGHGGGGASGRAVEFCLSKLSSNPRTDLVFWFRIAANLFSLGTGLFWKNEEWNGAYSSFSFPVSYHHCQKQLIKKCVVTVTDVLKHFFFTNILLYFRDHGPHSSVIVSANSPQILRHLFHGNLVNEKIPQIMTILTAKSVLQHRLVVFASASFFKYQLVSQRKQSIKLNPLSLSMGKHACRKDNTAQLSYNDCKIQRITERNKRNLI